MDDKGKNIASVLIKDEEAPPTSPTESTPVATRSRIFPWFGILVLCLSFLSVVASLGILLSVDNRDVRAWRTIKPSTCLSIVASATNVLVHLALAEGINIAWWYRASKRTTTLRDLHDYWAFGTSIKSAALAGKKINRVAIATLFVGLIAINGPLLQQTISLKTRVDSQSITNMNVWVAKAFPYMYSSVVTGRNYVPTLFTPDFGPVVIAQGKSEPIPHSASRCNGTCSSRVMAVGFSVNCTTDTVPYNLSSVHYDENSGSVWWDPVTVFNSNFTWNIGDPYLMNLTITLKDSRNTECEGLLITHTCQMQAGLLDQKIIVDNNNSLIMLDNTTTWRDDRTVALYTPPADLREFLDMRSTYGGIYLAMQNRFQSSMTLFYTGTRNYETQATGQTAIDYVVSPDGAPPNCTSYFTDPLDDILNTVRQLTFRAAVDIANPTHTQHEWIQRNTTNEYGYEVTETVRVQTPGNTSWVENKHTQHVNGTEIRQTIYYKVDYRFWGISVLLTLLSAIFVVPTFYGFWVLTRKTTLSPIETARAFNAPVISNSGVEQEVPGLLKEIGKKKIHEDLVFSNRVRP